MIDTIRISIDRSEGFLQRLIGLIERRGYAVEAISMPAGTSGRAELEITVAAHDQGRRIDVLIAQILRVIGVHAAQAIAATKTPEFAVGRQP